MSEEKTMLKAYITGTFPSSNGRGDEAYEITVLYSDGSKIALRKTYQEFIELQSTVYNLLTREGGYSKTTAKSLVKTLPELNNYLSQSLFREDDLKKIERLENFIKELLILPAVVRNSESVNNFFGAFMEKPTKRERTEKEEELKKSVKVTEVLSGRDPLRTLPKNPVLGMVHRTIKAELPPDDQNPETNEIFTRPGLFGRSTSDQGFKANTSRSPVAKRRFSAGADIVSISKENSVNYFCLDAPHIQSPGKTKEKQSKGDETTGYTEKTKSGIEVPSIQTASDQNEKSPRGTKYLAVSSYAGEESGVVSPQYGEEVEVLEKRSETQGKEIFIAMSERTIVGESDMEFHVQKQERSLRGTGEKESEVTESTEMNRRVKLVSVEGIQKRKTPDKNYVYILKVLWSDGNINIIYRQCSDFFFLQENLKKEFPKGSGKEIPMLKGRKFSENCQFCFKDGTCKRRQSLNNYFHDLINAPDDISNCKAILLFCRVRLSDLRPHGTSSKTDDKTNESNDPEIVEISGPVVFEQYIVIADYKKKNKNDISLTAGDSVDVLEKSDFGWWLVDHQGEIGWAPASHLEPTDDGAEITASKIFAPGQEEAYQAMQSYEARAEDELSFDIGVTLKVVEKNLDGWWLARYQGKEGWVPAVFLSRVVDSDDSSPSLSGKICELGDIASSEEVFENGDSERGRRSLPTRRSMVQRSIKKKPNKNTPPHQFSETRTAEEQNQGDTMSFSSGYHSYSSSSLSSLVSDVFAPEEGGVKVTSDSFDSCVVSTASKQVSSPSNVVTTLARAEKTSRSSANGSALTLGRRNPIPLPRSKSPGRSPQPRIDEIKVTPVESISEKEQENDSQNTRYQAIYTYISQDKNEITINEGDVVEVIKRSSNGWWLLVSNNQLGWGPSNYLEPV